MRKSKEQVAILQGQSAIDLQEQINEIIETAERNPVIEVDLANLRAFVRYTIDVTVHETIADVYESKGCGKHCADCPYLQYECKRDGNVDRRKKPICTRTGMHTTATARACDDYYINLQENALKGGNAKNERCISANAERRKARPEAYAAGSSQYYLL